VKAERRQAGKRPDTSRSQNTSSRGKHIPTTETSLRRGGGRKTFFAEKEQWERMACVPPRLENTLNLMLKFFTKAALACAAILSLVTARAEFTGFDSINYWVGSGSNQAAMVIDWNDGTATHSYVWGYRWDGAATGQDMFEAIVGSIIDTDDEPISEGADPALSAVYQIFSFGDAVGAITYHVGGETHEKIGFGPSSDGFWAYYIFGGDFEYDDFETGPTTYDVPGSPSFASVNWFYSPVGFSDRPLINGSWDAWSWSTDFINPTVPSTPTAAAVPEPSTWLLLASAGVCVFIIRRAAHARKRVQLG
jgi:hypothetical protein